MGNLQSDYREFLSIDQYYLQKTPSGSGDLDAITQDVKTEQVKANISAKQIGFSSEAELLLVLGINNLVTFEEIYFGSFDVVRKVAKYSTIDYKRMISDIKLQLMNKITIESV